MFPALYDAHHGLYKEDLPFWLELAAQQHGRVLELGCGSGRVLLPLAEAGFHVVGLDNDPEMLHYLRSRCPARLEPAPLYFVGDICCFHLGVRFALVIVPCNTWSTLTARQRTQALVCIRAHLLPGGLFVFGVPNPTLLASLPARSDPACEEGFLHPEDGSPVQVSSGWRRGKQYFAVTWHYDHLLPDGSVRRLTARVKHALVSAEDYQRELEVAGLVVREKFGDFERSVYHVDSTELIVVAGC